jgi:hypothetical protein
MVSSIHRNQTRAFSRSYSILGNRAGHRKDFNTFLFHLREREWRNKKKGPISEAPPFERLRHG